LKVTKDNEMPKGFFPLLDTPDDIIRGDESEIKKEIDLTNVGCEECKLYKSCISPKMTYSGEGKKKILILAEAPGKEEDRQGTQLVGQSGKLLRLILKDLNLDLERDFWKINAVNCRPPDNITPTMLQIAACRRNVIAVIEECKPRAIIALGKVAMDSLLGARKTGRLSGISMTDFVGAVIPDQEFKTWICPSWHPSFVLRNEGREDEIIKQQLSEHIQQAINVSKQDTPVYDYFSDCYVIKTVSESLKIIQHMQKAKVVAFDLETTGRKPYREGQKIISCSVSDGIVSCAFPYFEDSSFRKVWNELMMGNVKKVAHNAKFDCLWMKVRGGVNDTESSWPENVIWDTMLGAHIQHNKKKTNLKYLLYILLGIAGYDSEIDSFMESRKNEKDDYGANSFNRIEQAPIDDLLKYNAMDSLGTYKLWEFQQESFSHNMKLAQEFFLKGSLELMKAEYNGLHCDIIGADKLQKQITRKMQFYEDKVLQSKELKKWDKPSAFKISSPQDLSYLVFKLMGKSSSEKTRTGKPKADKKTMESFLDIPVVEDVMEWRKWKKVRDTYLKGITVESVNGVIHPFFNLNTVDTYRSSSDSPNFQNIPKRNAEVSIPLRKLLRPRMGHKLGEYDYKAMEVAILACYNKDPTLIDFITSGNDMHRVIASKLFLKSEEEVTKKERYVAKNGFVFPTFYGSFYEHTGPNIWESVEDSTRNELTSKGIKSVQQFIHHVEDVENEFWEDKFPVAKEWTEKIIKNYNKKGFIDLYTGFRCYGPMSRNQVINYHIQGTAFHCLLWTFTQVSQKLKNRHMDTYLIGQIHDAIVPDVCPEEELYLDHMIWLYGTQKIREQWEWIIVPLGIEKSISEVDGNWAEMKEIGLLEE